MTAWTNDELNKIAKAEELDLSSLRKDGTLRKPTTIWMVRVGDDVYIRCINGLEGKWYRYTQERGQGHIEADGVNKDVSFENETDPGINEQIDAEFRKKYRKYAADIVDTDLTPQAKASTLKLVPR